MCGAPSHLPLEAAADAREDVSSTSIIDLVLALIANVLGDISGGATLFTQAQAGNNLETHKQSDAAIGLIVDFSNCVFLFVSSGRREFVQRLKLEATLNVHDGCVSKARSPAQPLIHR